MPEDVETTRPSLDHPNGLSNPEGSIGALRAFLIRQLSISDPKQLEDLRTAGGLRNALREYINVDRQNVNQRLGHVAKMLGENVDNTDLQVLKSILMEENRGLENDEETLKRVQFLGALHARKAQKDWEKTPEFREQVTSNRIQRIIMNYAVPGALATGILATGGFTLWPLVFAGTAAATPILSAYQDLKNWWKGTQNRQTQLRYA